MISTAFLTSPGTDATFSGIHNPGLAAIPPWTLEGGTELDQEASRRFFSFETFAVPNGAIILRDGLYLISGEIAMRGLWTPPSTPAQQQLFLTGRLYLYDSFIPGGTT